MNLCIFATTFFVGTPPFLYMMMVMISFKWRFTHLTNNPRIRHEVKDKKR